MSYNVCIRKTHTFAQMPHDMVPLSCWDFLPCKNLFKTFLSIYIRIQNLSKLSPLLYRSFLLFHESAILTRNSAFADKFQLVRLVTVCFILVT